MSKKGKELRKVDQQHKRKPQREELHEEFNEVMNRHGQVVQESSYEENEEEEE